MTTAPPPQSAAFQWFSRFNRDEHVWIAVSDAVLWNLAQQRAASGQQTPSATQQSLRCWSCGCSSGEEAYFARMIWQKRVAPVFPELGFTVLGTDLCSDKIDAARRGSYHTHSVKTLPTGWLKEFFDAPERGAGDLLEDPLSRTAMPQIERIQRQKKLAARRRESASAFATVFRNNISQTSVVADADSFWSLGDGRIREDVSFVQQDVTEEMPDGPFDLIMSRYAVCLYLEAEQKTDVLAGMVSRLRPGGFLLIGEKDKLPPGFCEEHSLRPFTYLLQTEVCPSGIREYVESVFQKDGAQQRPPQAGPAPSAVPDDLRLNCSTYSQFMQATGGEADWIAEQKRHMREVTLQRTSAKSANLLANAIREGRRDDSLSITKRMEADAAARLEKVRALTSARDAEGLAADATLRERMGLSLQEAENKVQSFFHRMQQDMAKREEAAKREEELPPLPRRKSRGASAGSRSSKLKRLGSKKSRSAPSELRLMVD